MRQVFADRLLATFEADNTLGGVLDDLTGRFGGNLWYRGESRLHPSPAMPVLGRPPHIAPPDGGPWLARRPGFENSEVKFPLGVVTPTEIDAVDQIRIDRPDDPFFYRMVGDDPEDAAWLALARHHDMPTRLLDVTRNLLVGLFFACWGSEYLDDDGLLFVFVEPYNPLTNSANPSIDDLFDCALGREIPTWRDQASTAMFEAQAARLATTWEILFAHPFLYECTWALNERMAAQSGAFLWRGEVGKSLLDGSNSYFVFQIRSGLKPVLLRQLARLGIHTEALNL